MPLGICVIRTADFGLVYVLATGAARSHGVDAQIIGLDVNIYVFRLRQDRHGRRRSVDATAGLGRRNALHAMHTRLELEARKDTLARDRGDNLLVAAEIALRRTDQLGFPAVMIGVAAVHAKQVGGEQCGLVTTRAGPDLENGAALVGGILRQQQQLQLMRERPDAGSQLVSLGARQLRHFPVGPCCIDELVDLVQLALRPPQRVDRADHWIELGKLLRKLDESRLARAPVELGLDGFPALDQTVELFLWHRRHVTKT